MARKPRNYAAEQQRRNELARQRGFTSRGQQRRAIERGAAPAIAPKLVRSPRTVAAQQRLATAWSSAGFSSLGAYRTAVDDSRDYSASRARRQIARYDPTVNAPNVSKETYTKAYLDAFVTGQGRYGAVRRTGGSAALRYYFVDVTAYYTEDEYEARYGLVSQS